jgi:hypothetical protein
MKLEQVVRKVIRWGLVLGVAIVILENYLSQEDVPKVDPPGYGQTQLRRVEPQELGQGQRANVLEPNGSLAMAGGWAID